MVAIEDGFEIEVFEKELIQSGKAEVKQEPSPVVQKETPTSFDDAELIQLCASGTIVLSAIPSTLGAVLTGKIRYHLINNSGFKIVFTIYANEKRKWRGLLSGSLENGASTQVLEIKREDLVDISLFQIQCLLFSESELPVTGSFKKEVGVLLPDLQLSNKNLKGTISFSKISTLYSEVVSEEVDLKDLFDQYTKPDSKKHITSVANKKSEENYAAHGILINEKEVDLHIEELKKDLAGLSNADMIQIQLAHFHKEMNAAMKQHFKRIVFIHGVGNGRLKQAIRDELRQYPGIAFRDAAQTKYGHGATEVIFV
ncbi:MAG: Smr/MutS family protein [Bacteroidetes bacterium]|nr:Smr/MutS family protein [Bacteroidota bacterium]